MKMWVLDWGSFNGRNWMCTGHLWNANNNQGNGWSVCVSQVGFNKNNNLREINDVGRVVGELEMNIIHEIFVDRTL